MFTRKQMKNIEFLNKQQENYNYYKSQRKYVSIDTTNLKELYKYNGYYIQGTNIIVNINKRPIKGGAFEYEAIGLDFINYLENK